MSFQPYAIGLGTHPYTSPRISTVGYSAGHGESQVAELIRATIGKSWVSSGREIAGAQTRVPESRRRWKAITDLEYGDAIQRRGREHSVRRRVRRYAVAAPYQPIRDCGLRLGTR